MIRYGLFFLGALCFAQDQEAQLAARHWADLKLRAISAAPPAAGAFLRVKSSRIQFNRIQDLPLKIGSQSYPDGLAMRSPGEVEVVLPRPARRFESALGADSNPVGYYSNAGRGNAIATVRADSRELFRSPILKSGAAAIPVSVDLAGARTLTLTLTSAGDPGPFYQSEWDQADWAQARITLDNGEVLKLSELPAGTLAESYPFDTAPPFSFMMDGKPSSGFLQNWTVERSSRTLDNGRTEITITWRDPASSLRIRCAAVVYDNFPVAEWTLFFKNDGPSPSPILENIHALDTRFTGLPNDDFVLHHQRGSFNSERDFEPLVTTLGRRSTTRFAPSQGRGSDGVMPYFNLEWRGRGAIVAVGWPGQWETSFVRENQNVQIAAGQENVHFRLLPGEEIRTPLVAILFWTGDWIHGQNSWRRWMIAHNIPRPGGALPKPMLSASSSRQTVEMQQANEANQIDLLRRTRRAVPIDFWWMDAGWYPMGNSWSNTGTWRPDPDRFPRGLAPVTEAAHREGLKTIVWFEPERPTRDSELARQHPDWILSDGGKGSSGILFLGNPDAWRWTVEHFSNLIRTQGIDLYRQDFNIEPLRFWRRHDSPDRQGISEIQHITGYLAYFDELRRRFPNLLIDTCASGGRRLDLETLRRAVPLWRSDHPFEPVSQQAQTYGISLWVPYHGTAISAADPYLFRSQMNPATGIGMGLAEIEAAHDPLNRLISQWRGLAANYQGDFYPLTSWSIDNTSWIAWQFHRSQSGEGMLQVFRRLESPFEKAVFKLRGLSPDSIYAIEPIDSPGTPLQVSGSKLLDEGVEILLPSAPSAALYSYRRIR